MSGKISSLDANKIFTLQNAFILVSAPVNVKSLKLDLHKKGAKSEGSNYRPVSLTSVCCKILESLICDYLMSYLLVNNLLSNKQYGFVKGISAMLQLLHMMDKWTDSLDDDGQMDVIYSDFEKAFDKVPHKRLISKLCNVQVGI